MCPPPPVFSEEDLRTAAHHLCSLMEGLTSQVFSIRTSDDLVAFLNAVAILRHLNLSPLSSDPPCATAFFLNLYHTLITHATLVFGPPNGIRQISKFISRMSYEVSGDVVSVAELESNVMRAPMPPPDLAFMKLLLPRAGSPYAFRMRTPEVRLNFAMNNGMIPELRSVVIYRRGCLEAQLEATTGGYLRSQVNMPRPYTRRVVLLPKVLQWYKEDVGSSNLEILTYVKKYLGPELKEGLGQVLDGSGFGSGKIKCRFRDIATRMSFLYCVVEEP
uniref:DUF547 domain-containing protein n=1 Tax=Octactis speculum TaxID=3111310 RepID=A0A7S2BSH5_9STRA